MTIDPNEPGWTTQSEYPQTITPPPPLPGSTSTRYVVASAITDTQLLPARVRSGATVWNDSTATLFLGMGAAAASATDATVKIGPGDYYEIPFGCKDQVRGIWDVANGAARISEVTP